MDEVEEMNALRAKIGLKPLSKVKTSKTFKAVTKKDPEDEPIILETKKDTFSKTFPLQIDNPKVKLKSSVLEKTTKIGRKKNFLDQIRKLKQTSKSAVIEKSSVTKVDPIAITTRKIPGKKSPEIVEERVLEENLSETKVTFVEREENIRPFTIGEWVNCISDSGAVNYDDQLRKLHFERKELIRKGKSIDQVEKEIKKAVEMRQKSIKDSDLQVKLVYNDKKGKSLTAKEAFKRIQIKKEKENK